MRDDVERTLGLLPLGLAREIKTIAGWRRLGLDDLYEIRLRLGRGTTLVTGGGVIPLSFRTTEEEMKRILLLICDGAIYAHRDGLSRGYASLRGEIRVGVCGRAAYDGGRMIGVGDVSALVFRFPAINPTIGEEIYRVWKGCSGNILIASPPSGGKTTALRALAALIGEREPETSVVVVDERSEIAGCGMPDTVDVLSGYERRLGIEVAYRTLSADVILVDEIATEDEAAATLSAMGVGVRVVATAHAASLSDLRSRRALSQIFSSGMFEMAVMINKRGGDFRISEEQISPLCGVV